MADITATLCAFATLAALVSVVVFLVRRDRKLAGLSAVCSLALAVNFPLFCDMDARSKGFLDLQDMHAALNAHVSDPSTWNRTRGAVVAAASARVPAPRAGAETSE